MNEELKIIIKAVTDEARKNLAEVKKELQGIDKSGEESGKSISESMKSIAKGAAAAVAAIAAVTAAMANLGKKAQEIQKGFAKLNTTFQNNGSTTAQAASSYKDLFSFLGDHDKAIETGQLMAQITTNEKELAEWTNIAKGAFATFGDSLPIEGLTEAANETIKTGVVTGQLADALNWVGVSEDAFNAALAQTTSLEEREQLLRSTLNNLYGNAAKLYERNNQTLIQHNQSQADLNVALANTSAYTVPLLTALNNLGTTLLTVLAPALHTVAIYLTAFIQLMAEAIQWVGNFFGLLSNKSEKAAADVAGYKAAMKQYTDSLSNSFKSSASGIDDNISKIKELKKQTMGFDELNIVNSQTALALGGTSGGGGVIPNVELPSTPNPEDFGLGNASGLEDITEALEEAKGKLKAIAILAAIVAAGFAAWKIIGVLRTMTLLKREGKYVYEEVLKKLAKEKLDGLKTALKDITGRFMIIAGALLLIAGFSDAWVNGLDWKNFAAILGGLALVVGGIALSIGGIATPIALVTAGVVALVIGIKDLVTNGYSMEAVIMVAVGAIAVLIGVVWAFNAALLACPVTWIVVAIMAIVAVFIILWNECEGFRNFFINLWEGIKKVFAAVVEWFKKAGADIASFFVNAWNAIKKAWNAAGDFFKGIWSAIKNAFSSVGKWFADVFTGAWNGIKKVFSAVGDFFGGIWDTIKEKFTTIGSKIGDAVGGAFKTAINWVLEKAIGLINGFIGGINACIGILNKIPKVNIKTISKLEVPQLATGGIVTGDTIAHIGEQGYKEAVLPLERNTGWMDTLAERIAAKNGAPSRIALVIDGRELGYATINSINDITKQTGSLQLALV